MKRFLAALLLAPTLVFAQPRFELVTYLKCDSAKLLGDMLVELREQGARVAFTYNDPNTNNWTIFKLNLYLATENAWLYSSETASLSVHRTGFKELYEAAWSAAGRTHPVSCELIEQP